MKPGFLSAAVLAFAGAAVAAPPLAVPFARPTVEEERRMVEEAEEARLRAEAEEAFRLAAGIAPRADGDAETAPDTDADPGPDADPEVPPVPDAPEIPELPEAPETPETPTSPEVPEVPAAREVPEVPDSPKVPEAPTVPEADSGAGGPSGEPDGSVPGAPGAFRRDPFWPVALSRTRKADHDAAVAAAIEAEKRRAAIRKAREEAAAKGLDVSEMSDDDLSELSGVEGLARSSGTKSSSSFSGVSGEEWEAAEAKLPPRSGYLGGKKPALMFKGDKKPHFVGDEICVTNRNVVFTWRVSKVDFRAYAHEFERVRARPVENE